MPTAKPYHHGHLREALLSAAWELLEEGGADAVTLRAVARRAGVSHAAPHHHFATKGELVDALATEAYDAFTTELQSAWDGQGGVRHTTSLDALTAVGLAYVQFARARPHAFRLLNRPDVRPDQRQPSESGRRLAAAAARSVGVLESGIRACQDDGFILAGDPTAWSLLCWSGVHGLAMLLGEGLIPLGSCADEGELTLLVLAAMSHGLLSRGQPGSPSAVPG